MRDTHWLCYGVAWGGSTDASDFPRSDCTAGVRLYLHSHNTLKLLSVEGGGPRSTKGTPRSLRYYIQSAVSRGADDESCGDLRSVDAV